MLFYNPEFKLKCYEIVAKYQAARTSLVAQMVKRLLTMWESWV